VLATTKTRKPLALQTGRGFGSFLKDSQVRLVRVAACLPPVTDLPCLDIERVLMDEMNVRFMSIQLAVHGC
jgi:hypothetical protein